MCISKTPQNSHSVGTVWRRRIYQMHASWRLRPVAVCARLAPSCVLMWVCTISATNHIVHNHIGHTKRPYRPKRITISATKIVLLFSVNIVSRPSQSKFRTPVSHKQRVKELNSCRHISKRFDVSVYQ